MRMNLDVARINHQQLKLRIINPLTVRQSSPFRKHVDDSPFTRCGYRPRPGCVPLRFVKRT